MVKIKKVREKEKFIKHVFEIIDNFNRYIGKESNNIYRNYLRGFFIRNLIKPHKAKTVSKLNMFKKSLNFKEFKRFKERVRGENNGK